MVCLCLVAPNKPRNNHQTCYKRLRPLKRGGFAVNALLASNKSKNNYQTCYKRLRPLKRGGFATKILRPLKRGGFLQNLAKMVSNNPEIICNK